MTQRSARRRCLFDVLPSPFTGRIAGLCLAACLAVPGQLQAAPAAGQPAWAARADSIFQPVAQDADLTNVLIPEAIAEDAKGFLWIGDEANLYRWDGYTLKTYAADRSRADALPDEDIQCLHRDPRGTLWAGTVSGGLGRYDEAGDRFVAVLPNALTGDARHIWGMDDDGEGGLWLATGAGLVHLDAGGTAIDRPLQDAASGAGPANQAILAVLRDKDGGLWIGTQGGLAHVMPAASRFAPVVLPTPTGRPVAVSHLMQDGAGRIWVGSRQYGAYVIGADHNAAQSVVATAPSTQGLDPVATEINSMLEVAPGRVWIGTYGNGIFEVDGGDAAHARWIHHRSDTPFSLPSDSVQSLYRDVSGLVWVGTGNGLSHFTPDTSAIETMFGDPARKDGLAAENVMAVLALPDGSLWAGSQGKGYDVLRGDSAVTGMLMGRRVFGLASASRGGVLVGTDGGFYWADAAGRPKTRLEIPQHPAVEDVRALKVLNGTIWLGGRDDGLWKLNMAPDGTLSLLHHFDGPLLGSARVHAIEQAPDGRVAVGTEDGFSLIDPATDAVERVQADPGNPASLSPGGVVSFLVDRRGRLWVGTDDAGIYVMQGRGMGGHYAFHHIGLADGLPNGDINKMLLDHAGRVWASTDNGLVVVDPSDFSTQALRRADGVAIKGYWSGAGDETQDGTLVFGGMGGITMVHPDAVTPWRYRPPVVVTGVRLGGKALERWSGQVGASQKADSWLVVPPQMNSLSVEFAALDYSAPERNQYRYRLDGFDQGWIETDARHRVASYTNLPPGDFTLILSGSDRDGVWAAQDTSLRIRVLPAWYQALWFKLLAGGSAALLLSAAAYAWSFVVRQRQRDLERQVAERTAELSASQLQLQHFAYFDSLTALQNRRAFTEQFRAMIEEASAMPSQFALLLIDLDRFKQINDAHGHDIGDGLLVQTAARLRDAVRENDFLARLGGDEFAVLLPNIGNRDVVERVCGRIVDALGAPMTVGGHTMQAGASVGVALFPDHGRTQEDLYRHVDQALYDAKRGGRGACHWYGGGRLRVAQ